MQAQEQGVEAFLNGGGPVLDVRSPAEFSQGHIPGAVNLPLFSDPERAAVGTTYKQQGRAAAVRLGLELVGPRLGLLAGELSRRAGGGGELRIHCWRGGLRSQSLAWLAGLQQHPVRLLQGGYKAFRRWVLAEVARDWPLLVLGGRTGSGKTDLLLELERRGAAVVDLEGLAQHRGSSFGGLGLPAQPSSEHFENRLAVQLRRLRGQGPIWVEAESAQVGRCRIPSPFWARMRAAPLLEIERPEAERVRQLVAVYGPQGEEALRQATERISRRLGPQRSAAALAAIAAGDWATACRQMLDYYDRCYDHDIASRSRPPLGRVELGDLDLASAAARLLAAGAGAAADPA